MTDDERDAKRWRAVRKYGCVWANQPFPAPRLTTTHPLQLIAMHDGECYPGKVSHAYADAFADWLIAGDDHD
mgnify:CR=1 FL=1